MAVLSPFALWAFGFPPAVVLVVGALVVVLVLLVVVPTLLQDARCAWRRLWNDEE